jgi:dCTP diphosphatase
MSDTTLDEFARRLRHFAAERGWDRIDTPKNLAIAVMVEAGELLEHFQWLREEESAGLSGDKLRQAELEMADVFIFLLRLADTLGIDLMAAAHKKIEINAAKYPADKVRGRAVKYTEL